MSEMVSMGQAVTETADQGSGGSSGSDVFASLVETTDSTSLGGGRLSESQAVSKPDSVLGEIKPPVGGKDGASSGDGEKKWYEVLPEDLRAEKSLHNFKTLEDATRAFVSAQKLIGRDKIVVPDPKTASAEDYQAVFKKLGLPESPKDYAVKLEEDSGLDPAFIEKVKDTAHKAGVLPKQLEAVLQWYSKENKAAMAAHQEQQRAAHLEEHQKLRREWGEAFDSKLQAARLALKDGATPEDMKYLESKGLLTDARLIRIFAKLGDVLHEGTLKGGNGSAAAGVLTPDVAQAEATRIMTDMNHPYNNPTHSGHRQAQLEVERLMRMAYPEKKQER